MRHVPLKFPTNFYYACGILACLQGLFVSVMASARPPEEAEFQAASVIGDDIADWVINMKPTPNSLGVFLIHSNHPLEQDFSTVIETEVMKNLARKNFNRVSSCAECRTPQVTVHNDRVVVSKGAPDIETIKKIGKKYPVESFLVAEVYRTKMAVTVQAMLYQNPTGVLLGSERFTVPCVSLQDTSVQVMFQVGLGKILSGKGSTSKDGLPIGGNAYLLEELGFAKGGLNLGAVSGGGTSLFYLNPTLSFRGRIGHSFASYSINPGVGYGFAPESRGFVLKSSLEFFLGAVTNLGVESLYFIPDKSGVNTMSFYLGGHIGISFGR